MSFHNISINQIQESDINKLIESINAIISTYERVHDGFFLQFKYGKGLKAIEYLKNKIKNNINANLPISKRYFQLLQQVYEFYSTLKNENYLREDFKELLANKLQDLQEANWESYEDNGTALNFLKTALEGKIEEKKETDEVWEYLCKNLLSQLENDTANGFVFTIAGKMGLHPPESNQVDKKSKNKIRGLDLIIQKAEKIKTNLTIDDNLFADIEDNPNANESKREIIKSILKQNSSLNQKEYELYDSTIKFQNNLRKNWSIENLVNLCVEIMKDYDDKEKIFSFYDIVIRMKLFIQSFVNNVINPFSEIFNLRNYCDEKKLAEQIKILKREILFDVIQKNEKNKKNEKHKSKDGLENNSEAKSQQSKDTEKYSISKDNLTNAMRLLNYICRDDGPGNQKIKKEVVENKAVLQALAGSHLYLSKHSRTHQQEETELFIKNIIELRNCPAVVIEHEALRYIKCEGNYDSLTSGRSDPVSDFRLECFIKSGLLSGKTILLEKNAPLEEALHAKISIFSPKPNKNTNLHVKADSQLKGSVGLRN